MTPLENFNHCLQRSQELDALGREDEAGAMLLEAEQWLDAAWDRVIRNSIRAMMVNANAQDAGLNPGNPLFLQELSQERFIGAYARRESFLSFKHQRSLWAARAAHAAHAAARLLDEGRAGDAADLLLESMRRDSASAAALEPIWRQAEEARSPRDGNDRAFLRLAVADMDTRAAVAGGYALAMAGDNLALAKTSGAVEVFAQSGEHLASHSCGLAYPLGCGGQDGAAWFASGGAFARIDPRTGLTDSFRLEAGRDYPEGADFRNLAFAGGLLWLGYYTEPNETYQGELIGVDPDSREVRVRLKLGECCPLTACLGQEPVVLDALTGRMNRARHGLPPLTVLDRRTLNSLPRHLTAHQDVLFVSDTTTLLAVSAAGVPLGRLSYGEEMERLTDISGLAVSADGRHIFAMDLYKSCLIRITCQSVGPKAGIRSAP